MRIRPDRMRSGLDGAILATDLADYLSRKGVPFRDCHRIVGRLVRESLDEGKRLDELGLDSLRAVSDVFEADVSSVLSPENSTNDRNLPGGTGRDAIVRQIEAARQITSASSV